MNKPLFLYVEELRNDFVDCLIKRKDISLVLIRFKNSMNFSSEHIKETKHIPCFIIDKSQNIIDETERLRVFLSKFNQKVSCFYNDSEYNQEYIQRIARSLNLNGALTERQATIVRDKAAMKDFISEIGLVHVDYCIIDSFEKAKSCSELWGYPFIIKWRRGVSSIEVYKIENIKQLVALNLDYSTQKYIGEKYCKNKIWCIDAIVSNNRILNNMFTWLPFTNLEFATTKTKFAQIAVGKPNVNWKISPKEITQRIVSGLGMQNGYLHLEAFVDEDGFPTICEFAWRTTGDHILSNYSELYKVSIPDILINVLLGLDGIILPEIEGYVSDVFLPIANGKIRKITSLKELSNSVDYIQGEIFLSEGDEVVSKNKYTDCSGWIQLSSKTISEMMDKIECVYASFVLETETCE